MICAAQNDTDAFQNVKNRLVDDVGGILLTNRIDGLFTPFWAVARMLFPIAESIGDLIYQNDIHPTINLEQVFQNEFEEARIGYKNKANLIAQLYRHSLTHTDELRELKHNEMICTWLLALDRSANHLSSERLSENVIRIHFDLLQFYDDIKKVLDNLVIKAAKNTFNDKIKERYNGWTELDISHDAKYQKARTELEDLFKEPKDEKR